jgi:hypothetical protein
VLSIDRPDNHVPLLALFGGLTGTALTLRDRDSMRAAAARAKDNLQRCVIGNTDDTASTRVLLDHFFPAIADALDPASGPRLNSKDANGFAFINRGNISLVNSPLPADTATAFRAFYAEEMDVYDFALALHERQLQFVTLTNSVA